MWAMIVKAPNLAQVFHKYEEEFADSMNRCGFAIVREAKKKAPVYRGLLRNRIVHEVRKGAYPYGHALRVYVPAQSNGFYYARAVEFGTKPHRPPFQPIYRWVWLKRGGLGVADEDVKSTAWVMVNKIARVGTKPQPFLHPSADKVLKSWRWWK